MEKALKEREGKADESNVILEGQIKGLREELESSKKAEKELQEQIGQKNEQIQNWKNEMKESDHQKAELKE